MRDTLWDFFVKEYSEKTNMSIKTIEYISVYDILKLCVEGYSNKTIAKRLQMPIRYIEDVLVQHLNFFGWEQDLDFSPIAIYKEYHTQDEFKYKIYEVSCIERSQKVINMSYNICIKFTEIKEYLKDNGWSDKG